MRLSNDLYSLIYSGRILYEIVFEKDGPYIFEWEINAFEFTLGGVFLSDKFIGVCTINEDLIGSVFFFSYNEALERLNILTKGR